MRTEPGSLGLSPPSLYSFAIRASLVHISIKNAYMPQHYKCLYATLRNQMTFIFQIFTITG